MSEVTQILQSIARGDARAADELIPLVYDELKRLASRKLAHEPQNLTLGATALVHEAYVRLVDTSGVPQRFDGRGHFFAAAAEAMRRILVDAARRRNSLKRGGNHDRETLDPEQIASPQLRPTDDLLALDDALNKLAAEDPAKAELVKLRYFAGLTLAQASQVLGISHNTADRWWAYARAFLLHEITSGD